MGDTGNLFILLVGVRVCVCHHPKNAVRVRVANDIYTWARTWRKPVAPCDSVIIYDTPTDACTYFRWIIELQRESIHD